MFDELLADDFVDHTPQPDIGADKEGVRGLHKISARRYIGSVPTATR